MASSPVHSGQWSSLSIQCDHVKPNTRATPTPTSPTPSHLLGIEAMQMQGGDLLLQLLTDGSNQGGLTNAWRGGREDNTEIVEKQEY